LKESKFGYAVARTRSWENTLLDKNRLERLLAAQSLEETLAQLGDTIYAEAVGELENPRDYERALEQVLIHAFAAMAEMGHLDELKTLSWRYDFVNLKLILRAKRRDEEPRELSPLGSLDTRPLLKGDWEALPAPWQEAVLLAQGEEDPQKLDLILDRTFFQEALKYSSNPYLALWWRLEIDLTNIRTFFRLSALEGVGQELWHESKIPGGELEGVWGEVALGDLDGLQSRLAMGKFGEIYSQGLRAWRDEGSLSLWERLADNMRVEYIKRAKYIPFGPEPLVAYILGREHESKLLRIILAGKANNLAASEIRERLREVYG
jgi:V/A-type H+-transporting ATPase subunit C